MNKKIKVSKKMFLALEECLRISTKEELLKDHISSGEWISEEFSVFNNLSILEMAEILINDYELEETPEEKLLTRFNYCSQRCGWHQDDETEMRATANAIKETLEILNIKIKGINE